MSTADELGRKIDSVQDEVLGLREAVEGGFLGHRDVVDMLVLCILAKGHALLEGAPGLGKTTLVKVVSRALDLEFRRIQFTPDLLPADILGTRILETSPEGGHSFRFEQGPVFANILLADEINRATPRTQSALLEAMQEGQVTLFGKRNPLPDPFCVIATQNPIEMEGTYPLPEAQLDRFLCKLELFSPSEDELVTILEQTTSGPPPAPAPALTSQRVVEIRALSNSIPVSSDLLRTVARLIGLTHPKHSEAPDGIRRYLRYGASPRAGQAILFLAKARALLRGRPWVSPEDVREVSKPALRHRLVFSYEGEASGVHADELLEELLERLFDR